MNRLPTRLTSSLRTTTILRSQVHARYSSGSPTPSSVPDNHFTKTGERAESDPVKINMRSDEYSKSGGDDMVAEQEIASFGNSADTDPLSQKTQAGKGNAINPLEISPANPEVSRVVSTEYVEKNVERSPDGVRSGQGISKKAKKVEKVEIDMSKIKMRGR
ncbi:hypothetical protein K458DRAFT_434296 [Lentithecium fluviatile CBS 122367]|uniref:Uncharacterized protein n=1 Tax=Lentithecium fluviatile CBS 122367 TaxID=1168545 RepID=A0A6G1IR80_9PLEO|nr:hypothetical protein K458DRAFT_434296 [Lentithecium fluviatile CBS 122367]